MQHTLSARIPSKKALSARRGGGLVRLARRDLGLGAAGLAVVRALVVAGGDGLAAGAARSGAVGEGRGGGSRSRRGGRDTMGSADRISH